MTITQLAHDLGKSNSSIRRYVSKLLEKGIIECEKDSGRNVYRIKKDAIHVDM